MVHSVFQVVLGYLFGKYFPSWLRLRDSKVIDHYVIVGLSLIGILMMIVGAYNVIRCLLW